MTIIRKGRRVFGGSATITAGNVSVTVTHSLGVAPAWVVPAPTNAYATGCRASAKTTADFTIEIETAQAVDATLDYAYAL